MIRKITPAGAKAKYCDIHIHCTGERHHSWNGGRTTCNEYWAILLPNHPDAWKKDGYVLEHRWVMEQHIGRRLLKSEDVHHINGNKKDNRIENLEVFTHSEHTRLHNPIKYRWGLKEVVPNLLH